MFTENVSAKSQRSWNWMFFLMFTTSQFGCFGHHDHDFLWKMADVCRRTSGNIHKCPLKISSNVTCCVWQLLLTNQKMICVIACFKWALTFSFFFSFFFFECTHFPSFISQSAFHFDENCLHLIWSEKKPHGTRCWFVHWKHQTSAETHNLVDLFLLDYFRFFSTNAPQQLLLLHFLKQCPGLASAGAQTGVHLL